MSRFRFMFRMFAFKRDRLRVAQALDLAVISTEANRQESPERGYLSPKRAPWVCPQAPTHQTGDAVPPASLRLA